MGFDDMLGGRPSRTARLPLTATVTAVDADGSVYVTAIGDDTRTPIGPCRGAVRLVLEDDELRFTPLQEGALVLLVFTSAGPWVANWEGA